jgi:UDP-N-acetylmuramoyl-tripeptide--D-alanyl-D-alanine ligase
VEIQKLYELYSKYPQISTDSRSVKENSLFFALKGKYFDGNKFAESAIQSKAAYAVVDKLYTENSRFILVDDTLRTLQKLAGYHRKKCGFKILAITGSNGKTTTKELIFNILSKNCKVYATEGNLNNHIGVPLTILAMAADTEIGIVEMGANHHNEIAELCDITEPDFGLITNIGKAHLEGFGSIEGVKKAKQELFIWLKNNNGTILGNVNDSNVKDIIPGNYENIVLYGNKASSYWADYISSDPFLKFVLFLANDMEGQVIQTNLFGRYNMENAIAAATFATVLKSEKKTIKQALEEYIPENNRSQILKTVNNKIFLDAYNANPTSMKAAIEDFIEVSESNKYFILGEMLEVGTNTGNEHKEVLSLLKGRDISNVICVGKAFKEAAGEAGYKFYNDINELAELLKSGIIKNASVLIKGSRANQLEKLIQFL